MILINLLPHREAARKRRREAFYASLGLAVVLGLLMSGLVYLWLDQQISAQQGRNDYLKSEITKLDGQIKEISTLQAEITALQARQKAVEDLQSDRNLPVHLLNGLVQLLPDGVYLTTLRQENNNIIIQGVAQSNERVSELLRSLSTLSEWIKRPELVEIIAVNVNTGGKDLRRVSQFSIRATLDRGKGADTSEPKSALKR
ncbi:MAG TPA: PilN domain-containing protein [Burkholderiaceae bacterium]|nr:PilN domain-containing protein [Burkholderiaceae bacterium]